MAKNKEAVVSRHYSTASTLPVLSGLLFLLFWAPLQCGAQNFFTSAEIAPVVIRPMETTPAAPSPNKLPDSLDGPGYNSSRTTDSVPLNSQTWPAWFTSEPQELTGVGIASYSQYNPQQGFNKAFQKAIQDLNANAMISVYLESFSFSGYSTQYFDEFAIPSLFDSTSVARIDSSAVGNWAFAMVKPKSDSAGNPEKPMPQFNVSGWTSPDFFPVNQSGYWISAGMHEKSEYAPYQSWSHAKQDALSRLSHYIQTGIENTTSMYNRRSSETTYTYSKCLIHNVRVVRRKTDSDSLYVLIAVHQDDIKTIN